MTIGDPLEEGLTEEEKRAVNRMMGEIDFPIPGNELASALSLELGWDMVPAKKSSEIDARIKWESDHPENAATAVEFVPFEFEAEAAREPREITMSEFSEKFGNTDEHSEKTEIRSITQESGEPTDDTFAHLPVLEDVGHPLVPDEEQYLHREIQYGDGVRDVDITTKVIASDSTNLLWVGETGVGKNACIDHTFHKANWPRVRVNMGTGVTYESLVGKFVPVDESDIDDGEVFSRAEAVRRTADRLIETDVCEEDYEAINIAESSLPSVSNFHFQPGVLYRCVQYGWAFVADEINAMPPEVSLPMNEITEKKSKRKLTVVEKNEQLNPHPRFAFVATMNPPTYPGTKKMNQAFKNRFLPVRMPPLEKEKEIAILEHQTDMVDNGVSTDQMHSLVDLVNNIRRQDMMSKVSTRDLIKIGEMTDIMKLRDAATMVLTGVSDEADEEKIYDLIQSQKGL